MGTPRRVWSGVALPAHLHAELSARSGHRGLTGAVVDAIQRLVGTSEQPIDGRPGREHGTIELSLRLPVAVADAADRWRQDRGLSRQALVELAVVQALRVMA